MKKVLLVLIGIFTVFSKLSFAQIGASCISAEALNYYPSPLTNEIKITDRKQYSEIAWVSFIVNSAKTKILIDSKNHPGLRKIRKAEFMRTCSQSSSTNTDSLISETDSSLTIEIDNLIVGNTYYLGLTKGTFSPCTNDVSPPFFRQC